MVSWTPPSDDGGSPIIRYEARRRAEQKCRDVTRVFPVPSAQIASSHREVSVPKVRMKRRCGTAMVLTLEHSTSLLGAAQAITCIGSRQIAHMLGEAVLFV